MWTHAYLGCSLKWVESNVTLFLHSVVQLWPLVLSWLALVSRGLPVSWGLLGFEHFLPYQVLPQAHLVPSSSQVRIGHFPYDLILEKGDRDPDLG